MPTLAGENRRFRDRSRDQKLPTSHGVGALFDVVQVDDVTETVRRQAVLRDRQNARYRAVVDSALDGWFTTGRWAKEFERKLARFVGVRSASLVNSGSSANLVALSALTSSKLGERALRPGDEVITTPFTFFATAGCISRVGARTVFVDIDTKTFLFDLGAVQAAVTARLWSRKS